VKRLSNLLCLLLVVAGFAAAGAMYPGLPDPMPTHWNAAGQVNGWMPKFWGAFLFPLLMTLLWLVFSVLPRISPRGFEMEPFLRAWGVLKVTILALLLFVGIEALRASKRPGMQLSPTAIFCALGVLFAVIGNLLGKVTRNFFVGIRTPWTLASEEVWYRTHRLAGKLFVAAGVFIVVASLFAPHLWTMLAPLLIAALIPVVYSYVIYKRIEGLPARPAA
jgi:uncharacterized membrane protein